MVRVIGYDAVNLFAGAGGWDVAARNLGIRTLGFELWKPAVETQRAAGLDCQQADVRLCSPLDDSALTPGFIASPPCQAFSIGGKGAGRKVMDDIVRSILLGESQRPDMPEGAQLILEPLRWIQSRLAVEQPYRWIAMEQVPTCLPIWQAYAAVLARYGYNTAYGNLQAEQYGTPQTRKRSILIAHWQMPVGTPVPTHSRYYPRDPQRLDSGVLPWVSMADALGWTEDAEVVSNYNTGGIPGQRGIRLGGDPSATVTTKIGKNKVWFHERPATVVSCDPRISKPGRHDPKVSGSQQAGAIRVSVADAGVLQGFPADYPWQGNSGAQYTQVGNAIPVQLAQAVLSAVAV